MFQIGNKSSYLEENISNLINVSAFLENINIRLTEIN